VTRHHPQPALFPYTTLFRSINSTTDVPSYINKGWFMFYVTFLNQIYWVGGTTLGILFSSAISFNTDGLEFVMVALFVVIFLDQRSEEHTSELQSRFDLVCRL